MWDLGNWPLVIVAHLNDKAHGVYAVATYTEGDITVRAFTDRAERDAAPNEVAAFHWRLSTVLFGLEGLQRGRVVVAHPCLCQ